MGAIGRRKPAKARSPAGTRDYQRPLDADARPAQRSLAIGDDAIPF
jgi:hypothetical protein